MPTPRRPAHPQVSAVSQHTCRKTPGGSRQGLAGKLCRVSWRLKVTASSGCSSGRRGPTIPDTPKLLWCLRVDPDQVTPVRDPLVSAQPPRLCPRPPPSQNKVGPQTGKGVPAYSRSGQSLSRWGPGSPAQPRVAAGRAPQGTGCCQPGSWNPGSALLPGAPRPPSFLHWDHAF